MVNIMEVLRNLQSAIKGEFSDFRPLDPLQPGLPNLAACERRLRFLTEKEPLANEGIYLCLGKDEVFGPTTSMEFE